MKGLINDDYNENEHINGPLYYLNYCCCKIFSFYYLYLLDSYDSNIKFQRK